MNRYAIALISAALALCLVFAGSLAAVRARTQQGFESLAASLEGSPSGVEDYVYALLETVPTRTSADKGSAAISERFRSGYSVSLFMDRLWSDGLLFGVLGAICAVLLGISAFLIIDRRRRIQSEERLAQRISAALRGEEVFRAENDGERTTAALLAEIERLKALRESSSEEMRLYVENVAHEIKTPASGLILNLDLMEKSGQTPEKLAALRKCALRISSYVNGLLSLARVSAGKMRFKFEPFDLGELARETADDLRANGMSVEVSGEGCEINGDRIRLKEAVQNLMINAAKHSLPGEPVRAELSHTQFDASLRVKNTGSAPAEDAVIERYSVGSEDGTSSGIGLSLARAVALRHSGKLNVRPTSDGAEAELVIPRFSLKQSLSE